MLTLLTFPTLHFGPPYMESVGEASSFAGENASDIIVASGDFTQRAKPEQFAAARAFPTVCLQCRWSWFRETTTSRCTGVKNAC